MALDNVITLISDAIEASYYLSPAEPGLNRDEVMGVMAALGHPPGEVADALDRLVASARLTPGSRGLVFRPDTFPVYLEQFEYVFDGDPRNRQAFAYVADLLRDASRDKGVRNTRLSANFLAMRGASMGFPEADMILAAYWLSWMKIATISDGIITPTDRLLKGKNADPQQALLVAARRPDFVRVYDATRDIVAQRSERLGWRELRDNLHRLDIRLGLAPDEELTLDTIISLFADTGESVSLDDVLRMLPQYDVRRIVHARFEQSGLIHTRTDTRVLPSLLALQRAPDLFMSLLLALNEALQNARVQWEGKTIRAPLTGPHGLLPIARPDAKQNRVVREIRLLLDSLSFAPALYPANTTEVEIRDEVRHLDTLPKLIEYQANMRDVGASVRANFESSYTAFLATMLVEAERSFHVFESIDLRNVARQLNLDVATVRRFVERARNEGIFEDVHARNAEVHRAVRPHPDSNVERAPVLHEQLARWLVQQGDGQNTTSRVSLGSITGQRAENQDRTVFARIRGANRMQLEIAIICDGIGGMEDGALCACLALASFLSELATSQSSNVRALLERAIDAANRDVFRMRAGRGGTTLSSVVFFDSNALACHVGDGRIYGLNETGTLTQLSPDDTVKGQLDAMGVEREENVPLHERLVQYVGMGEELHAHIFPIPADTKLAILTSDGAHRVGMPIFQHLARHAPNSESLVARLLALADWTGGIDNASAIALPTQPAMDSAGTASVVEVWSPVAKAEFFEARGTTSKGVAEERAHYQRPTEKRHRKRRSTDSPNEIEEAPEMELSFSVGPASPSISPAVEETEPKRTATERGRKQ